MQHSPPQGTAQVVVFEHPVVARDCVAALQALGFAVTYAPLAEDSVMALMTSRPDYVLTVNFNKAIAEACELLGIAYLAWVIDTPCYPIYDKAVALGHSFTFVYDVAVALRLRQQGVQQVYHLPVAVHPPRIGAMTLADGAGPDGPDISFVANLTRTEYRQLILPRLSAATASQCARLIDSLDTPRELFDLDERLDPALVEAVSQESGYPLTGDRYLSVAQKLAYLLGREHSWQERIALVRQLEARFALKVYGNAEWQDEIGCYAGNADHFQDMPKLFHRSRINLNLSRSFVEYGLPMRVFDVLGCEGFLVTNDKMDLHALFTPGKDLVVFRDTQELLEICAYYLAHEQERREIARRGFETVCEQHTFEQRMVEMFTTVQQVRAGQTAPLSRWYS